MNFDIHSIAMSYRGKLNDKKERNEFSILLAGLSDVNIIYMIKCQTIDDHMDIFKMYKGKRVNHIVGRYLTDRNYYAKMEYEVVKIVGEINEHRNKLRRM